MKFEECKKGTRVIDRWFSDWGAGRIVRVFKHVVRIKFANGETLTYDKPHLQFLDRVCVSRKKSAAR